MKAIQVFTEGEWRTTPMINGKLLIGDLVDSFIEFCIDTDKGREIAVNNPTFDEYDIYSQIHVEGNIVFPPPEHVRIVQFCSTAILGKSKGAPA